MWYINKGKGTETFFFCLNKSSILSFQRDRGFWIDNSEHPNFDHVREGHLHNSDSAPENILFW